MEGRERRFAVVIAGVHGMDHLLKRLIPPLIPVWGLVLGFPLWQLGLLVGVQTFGAAIGQAPIGVLSDRYDRRHLLSTGIGVGAGGIAFLGVVPYVGDTPVALPGAGFGLDPRFVVMFVGMLGSGIGSSFVHPTGYPLITANVAEAHKGRVLGLWGSASKFGEGVAPAIVGAALLAVTWDAILVVVGLVGVGYAALLFVLLGDFETRPVHAVPGATDPSTAGPRDRVYRGPLLAVAVYFVILVAASTALSVFLPEFVASVYGYSVSAGTVTLTAESTASFYFAVVLFVAAGSQLGSGALVDLTDARWLIIAYVLGATAGLVALATATLSPVILLVVLALLGGTMWGMNPARDALISDLTPADREGRAFGYIWTVSLLVGSTAPPAIGYIADVAGLRTAFLVLAGAVLLSAVPILLLGSDLVPGWTGEGAGRPG